MTLNAIALRSAGWITIRVANIDHFRAIPGSKKGMLRLLDGSLGLSVTVGLGNRVNKPP